MIILTSGCSFTQYKWPSWANYLKEWSTDKQPHQVINVGDAGIDNSIITYRMMDYLCGRMPLSRVENEHDPKDVEKVCVMWTGYERYCPRHKDIITHTDKNYVGEHFDPYERLRNLAMCIDTINLLCQSKNIKCYSFFYFKLSEQEQTYLNHMTAGPWNLNYTAFSTFRSNNEPVYGNDIHPTPLDQWRFANEVVAPYIGLTRQRSVPEIVKEHEKLVREKRTKFMDPDMSKYSHRDKLTYFTKNMDPFIPPVEDEFLLMSIDSNITAMERTQSAFVDTWSGHDTLEGQNWLDKLINRIRKF